MTTYAIGDIHGCYDTLTRLLERIHLEPSDTVWLVGDLVNRGPKSLAVLRWAKELGERAIVVLGNHDLHLLAVAAGVRPLKKTDNFAEILAAPDRDELIEWLRARPILHREGDYVVVHAGFDPSWTIEEVEDRAREVEATLRGPDWKATLAAMYEDGADHWDAGLEGPARTGFILKTMTRLRVCRGDGTIDDTFTGTLDELPPDTEPWFRRRSAGNRNCTVVFGHWAALGYHREPGVVGLDSGCGWGRELTAVRLPDGKRFAARRLEPL